jgi:hypothetical protein
MAGLMLLPTFGVSINMISLFDFPVCLHYGSGYRGG